MAKIIGLTGFARSGEDTVAAHLTDAHGYYHESFAWPIREMVRNLLGYSWEEFDAKKEAPVRWLNNITPRRLMQTLGTEWGRNTIHPDIWTRACAQRIHDALARHQGVVISDVRFQNEAEMIRTLGGEIWFVHRPAARIEASDHVSETTVALLKSDHVLHNDTSIPELRARVDALLAGAA